MRHYDRDCPDPSPNDRVGGRSVVLSVLSVPWGGVSGPVAASIEERGEEVPRLPMPRPVLLTKHVLLDRHKVNKACYLFVFESRDGCDHFRHAICRQYRTGERFELAP